MKIRKPFVMGGMLLVAALLFLSMFMDMSAPQEMERQTISLRAEAEDLSIDDMINTSDKRKRKTGSPAKQWYCQPLADLCRLSVPPPDRQGKAQIGRTIYSSCHTSLIYFFLIVIH